MRGARWLLVAVALMAVLPRFAWSEAARPGSRAPLEELEGYVARHPEDCEGRRLLAARYEARGFVEEAVAQHLAVLVRAPGDESAGERVRCLVAERMPAWLPGEGVEALPFAHDELGLELACAEGQGERTGYRLLVSREGFAAREGERQDPAHEWRFARIDYGYVWEPRAGRWVMRLRAHWEEGGESDLAGAALRTALALYCTVREYLELDPTRPWEEPVDIWLARSGAAGGRAVGSNIYLYSMGTPRPGSEWFREVAHEYGHVALPGIGGFTETDDAWADGHLGELLFGKWLAAARVPEWLPWPVAEWEREAAVERARLMAGAEGEVEAARLEGLDEEARDYFLGLALRVEEERGPRFLGEALRRCARGRPEDFAAAAGLLGE